MSRHSLMMRLVPRQHCRSPNVYCVGLRVRCLYSANRCRFRATSPFRPALNCIAKAVADASGPESKWLMPSLLGFVELAPWMERRATPAPTPRSGKILLDQGVWTVWTEFASATPTVMGRVACCIPRAPRRDGHVADRRLLPDVEALQLDVGLQAPFRWPEGLALPFGARLETQPPTGSPPVFPCASRPTRVFRGPGR